MNSTGNLMFVFKPSGLPFNKKDIHFDIWANSTSNQLSKNNKVRFKVQVIKRAEVSIKG